MTRQIQKLNHAAYRCRDSEETRAFYEDFLGLEMIDAFEIKTTMTGRDTRVLHSFYAMADGGCIAFFEAPDMPFKFVDQHDFDLHIALEVDMETLHAMFDAGKAKGIETRGISDHGFIHSIYFRDPNGYVVELSAPVDDGVSDSDRQAAGRKALAEWTARKTATR